MSERTCVILWDQNLPNITLGIILAIYETTPVIHITESYLSWRDVLQCYCVYIVSDLRGGEVASGTDKMVKLKILHVHVHVGASSSEIFPPIVDHDSSVPDRTSLMSNGCRKCPSLRETTILTFKRLFLINHFKL